MTTTTPCIDDRPRPGSRARRAFTLAEVMIAATLTALVLTGVLSALLLIGRSGYNASNYSAAEAEIQRGLDTFAEEVRQASDVRWLSRQCITLTIPTEQRNWLRDHPDIDVSKLLQQAIRNQMMKDARKV